MRDTSKIMATRPAGCTCTWQQIHMDMPWQRTVADPECPAHPVHGAKPAIAADTVPREDLGGL